jgi:hypothetical protein
MTEELKQLQDAWVKAKQEEDKAKQARLLLEDLILEKIGWTDGDANFKSWKDEIKITFPRKEEYDNEELKKLFQPQDWFAEEFPFRIKLEPDAKKMTEFKIMHNDFYMSKLAPLCKEKFGKPSFGLIDKKGA